MRPAGVGSFDFVWTHFGFADDSAEMTQRRLTLFHDPYYQRIVVGMPLVRRVDAGRIEAEANDSVFRTKLSGLSTVFNVGRYIDTVVRTPEGLKFASRGVIHDSEMIPNSIINPL